MENNIIVFTSKEEKSITVGQNQINFGGVNGSYSTDNEVIIQKFRELGIEEKSAPNKKGDKK